MHVLCDCHVLVELYYTFEPIWTNLLTQCTQLPASVFLPFLFFRFFGYLKCPKSSGKIILKISVQEASGRTKRGKRGHHQGARRVPGAAPTLGRAGCPPGCPVGPLDAPLRLYLPLGVETLKHEPFFAKPSLFRRRRRFKIGASWRSCSGTLPEGDTPSERPSIAMDASRMYRE